MELDLGTTLRVGLTKWSFELINWAMLTVAVIVVEGPTKNKRGLKEDAIDLRRERILEILLKDIVKVLTCFESHMGHK